MAFQCGFFNSINGDRKYTAEQMNNPYKGIVSNGVLAKENDSNGFQVQELSLLKILIKEGYGIFADKWAVLDADLILDVPTPHVNYARIDSVIVRVDTSDDVRAGSIEYVQGTAAQNPVQPTLTRTDTIKEYRLANITVPANAISITQANIEDTRPSAECGFVSNLLQNSDISATYAQWQAQFEEWLANNNAWAETKQAEYNEWTDAKRNEFENWFNNLTETLNVNTALQSYSSHYETTEENETVIPIGIFDYSSNLDVLKVYINGLMLIPLIDYTINDFSSITLIKPVDKGTIVAFNVIKSIIAPLEVEEVTYQVQRINSVIPVECGETNPLADKEFVSNSVESIIDDTQTSKDFTWSSSKIEKHSLPLLYASGSIVNNAVMVFKLANVLKPNAAESFNNLNLLLSTRRGDEIEIATGKDDNDYFIQAKWNFGSAKKISAMYKDGVDVYIRAELYVNFLNVYHKSGVLRDDFGVSIVDSVPTTATSITIDE